MMNRSTQKKLIKLMLQLNEMWPQLDLSNTEQQNMVLDILNTVSTKCQKDFSKVNADRYVDTVESLGNVIKLTDWQHMASEELNQCISLCQEIILQVINNLRNEKELKKDIVFLPYQASMWDSLESVWKAANEDKEHCNTYVIPIPYASLTPEHTAAEWHCERGLFPEYVPTLDWQTIDLEEMHPDVIFIHNPYDEYNRVTSVESRYYSSNLKHCTNKLVYIPYAVEEEIQPGNEMAETAIEHRILLPAFMNADLIIAQSEDMRQAWINILVRRTAKKDRAYWENRILGLGSPKIDKVLTSKKEDFNIPEQWKKLIKNKKVILYITSIAPMLQNTDKVCAKLRYVFDTFRNRDDVIIWWRPHPLMRATFHSMRPEYEEEYLSIEKKYIEEGWGIYDDSFDLHRAICWSDAYYGDYSSVLVLYRFTRKCVLLQVFGVTNEFTRLNCMDIINIGDVYYILAINGSLFKLQNKTRKGFYIGNIENKSGSLYYRLHLLHENKLLYTQYYHGNIIDYDIKNNKFSFLVECENDKKITQMPYNHIYSYNNKIFFFGCGEYASIMIFDEITREYTIDDRWIDEFERKYGKKTTQYYQYDACRTGQYIWLTLREPNMIMKYSMESGESTFYKIESNSNCFSTICYVNGEFWLTGEEKEIICWNPQTQKVRVFSNFPKGFVKRIFRNPSWNENEKLFNASLKRGNHLFFCPHRANMLIAINLETEEIIKIHDVRDETRCFPMVKLLNGDIFFQEKDFEVVCVGEYIIDRNNYCSISSFTSNIKMGNHVLPQFNAEYHSSMLLMLIDGIKSNKMMLRLKENTSMTNEKWLKIIRD